MNTAAEIPPVAKPVEATPASGEDTKTPVDAAKPVEGDKPAGGNAVPKPQLGQPAFKRRPEGKQSFSTEIWILSLNNVVVYDSQSEIPGRCEDWLLIPAKKYPLINWRFLLGGTGQTLAPLTLIERETGAAILVRNMKRTLNRRPTKGVGGMIGSAGFAEVQRFQEALAALQKAEREAAAMAVNEGTGGGGTANAVRGGDSNAAFPPTPKDDGAEGIKNRQLPGDGGVTSSPPNVNIKLADAAVTTPASSSPILDEAKLASAADAQNKAPNNLPVVKEEEELKEKPEQIATDLAVDEVKKQDDKMDIDKPVELAVPTEPEVIDPRTAPENKDIGLHCWIVGILQSEVDHAYARIQELIDGAIREYEVWLEEHGEETEEDEDEEVESGDRDKDVVMGSGQVAVEGSEAKNAVEVKL